MREPVKFGKYYLVERIAVGGMAEVFKAVTYGVEGFERRVALKRVLPDIAEDKEFTTMFIDEANIAVQLNHANISQIYELGNTDGSLFIAMEYVQGKDLRVVWDRARKRHEFLSIPMCCHIIKEVCEALEYAHNKHNENHQPLNLVHRDISPQNIILSYDGETKLIDFGIAKATGKEAKTQAGILKGKFGYMSPEQVRGRPIDRRSDLFSLAVVFYELLTLERCFQGESDFSTLEKVRNVDIRRPSTLNRDIPPELERILMKGLERNPEDRYQHASEFGEALQRFLYQTGNFYGRKELGSYIRQTFEKEFLAEQRKNAEFKEYAKLHIPEARRAHDAEDDGTANAETQDFHVQNPELNWDDDELSTAIWKRKQKEAEAPTAPPPQPLPDANSHQDTPNVLSQYEEPEEPNSHRGLILLSITIVTAMFCFAMYLLFTNPLASGLRISVTPEQAIVYIDGQPQPKGENPLLIEQLEAGKHLITAKAEGYLDYEANLELTYGEIRPHEIRLEPKAMTASVHVNSDPEGATILIDGQERGSTPIDISDLALGEHLLKLKKANYIEWSGSLNLQQPGQQPFDVVRMLPEFIEVNILPDPAHAELKLIQDERQQVLPKIAKGEMGMKLPSLKNDGQAKIVASAPGYQTVTREIPQTTDRKIDLEIALPSKGTAQASNTAAQAAQQSQQTGKTASRTTSKPAGSTRTASKSTTNSASQPKNVSENQEMGLFSLKTNPPGMAYIDKQKVKETPLFKYELPTGWHSIVVRNEEQLLYDEFRILIHPGDDQRNKKKLDLTKTIKR